jgi:hypothetical protein
MNNTPQMNAHFEDACNKAFHEKCRQEIALTRQEETMIATDRMDESQATRAVSQSRIDAKASGSKSDKDKKSDYLFYAMLDDINDRLSELREQMAELYQELNVKYGGDVVGGMASTFLSPDILAALNTEEAKLQALADEFLNEDGSIKDKYKDLPEAQFIQKQQEFEKLMSAEPKVQAQSLESSHTSSEASFTSSSFNFGKSL